jgi:hypothetical protein
MQHISHIEAAAEAASAAAARVEAASAAAARRAEAAAAAAARAEALRYNFISCLILAAQNGFGQDVDHLAALCRETWGEEQWWDAVKDLPLGRVRREGPARRGAAVPFGIERGPCSAGRQTGHLAPHQPLLEQVGARATLAAGERAALVEALLLELAARAMVENSQLTHTPPSPLKWLWRARQLVQ